MGGAKVVVKGRVEKENIVCGDECPERVCVGKQG